MAACKMTVMFNRVKIRSVFGVNFSTFHACCSKWRREQNLEPNPNSYGPLRNLPDFSFVDGRPVPLSRSKMYSIKLQRKLCQKIYDMSHELDVGLENYYKKVEDTQKTKQSIIKNKLKAKGAALLKKEKTN